MLHLSAEAGNIECVQWTLDNFPQMLKVKNNNNYSALYSAVSNGHVEVIKILEQYGINPNDVDDTGK